MPVEVLAGLAFDDLVRKGNSNALVALFVECGPVSYAGVEKTDVDVIEMIWRVNPFAATIVRFEAKIWGRRNALAGGKIGALVECELEMH